MDCTNNPSNWLEQFAVIDTMNPSKIKGSPPAKYCSAIVKRLLCLFYTNVKTMHHWDHQCPHWLPRNPSWLSRIFCPFCTVDCLFCFAVVSVETFFCRIKNCSRSRKSCRNDERKRVTTMKKRSKQVSATVDWWTELAKQTFSTAMTWQVIVVVEFVH